MDPNQQELLANALSSIADAVFITDRDGRIVWANEAFSRLSGYAAHETLGRSPAMLKSGRQDAEFYRDLWQTPCMTSPRAKRRVAAIIFSRTTTA